MNINIKIEKETRKVFSDKYVIGNDAENLQGNLIFTFDEFVDGQARLEFEAKGIKDVIYPEKNGETYQAPILSKMTKEGQIDMQLVITEGTDEKEVPVFKSNMFYLFCNSSINAVDEAPDGYELWIEQANTKLNQVDNLDISIKDGVVTIFKKDGTTESENVKGEPNTLTIGEVVTGDIAQATITGEAPNQTLNLVLPKGEKGDTGLKGDKGEKGETGAQGIQGPRGLQGEKGDKGDRGEQGVQGIQGIQGLQGENGIDGKDGNGISSITRYYLATDVAGGSEVIEWDGDTTDRENYQYFYKVSDKVFTEEEIETKLMGAEVEITAEGETITMTIDGYSGSPASGNRYVLLVNDSLNVVTIYLEGHPEVSPGTYFLHMEGFVSVNKLTIAGGGISTDAEGWTTEIQTMTPTNKYLWSYEVVEFTDGTNNTSEPVIIGVYGDKGADGQTPDMSGYYTKEETNTAISNAIGTALEGSY